MWRTHPVISLLELHFPEGSAQVVTRYLLHVVEFEELIPPMAVHVYQNVAVLVGSQRLNNNRDDGNNNNGESGKDNHDSNTQYSG